MRLKNRTRDKDGALSAKVATLIVCELTAEPEGRSVSETPPLAPPNVTASNVAGFKVLMGSFISIGCFQYA